MNHGSLFSGIGGFDLAAQWMGWTNIFHCEWNEFGQKVLKHYWPDAISYGDITKTDFTIHRGSIDILTGGFPCQPFSVAGKRKGTEDDRHLWPEMLRAIREIQPQWIVGENVSGIVSWDGGLVFEQVCADLENEGYEVQPVILPAVSVNAPHRRDRVWFIAYRTDTRFEGLRKQEVSTNKNKSTTDTNIQGLQKRIPGRIGIVHCQARESKRGESTRTHTEGNWSEFPTQSPVCRRDDGLPTGLSGITFSKHRNESIKAYGNAIVPQVAFEIFKVIEQMNNQ